MKKLSTNNTLPTSIKDNEIYLLLCIVVILAKYNIYNTVYKYLEFILKCTHCPNIQTKILTVTLIYFSALCRKYSKYCDQATKCFPLLYQQINLQNPKLVASTGRTSE